MNTNTLSVILSSVYLLNIGALGSGVSQSNGATIGSGSRVLNGQVADSAEFPFLVLLRKGYVICGGGIISDRFILTAAHCIFDLECTEIEIFPSTWREGDEPKIRAVQCYVHEKFVDPIPLYDIALIQTHDDLLDDKNFKAIPLPAPGTHYPKGTRAVIVGWGKTEGAVFPNSLLRADVLTEDWDTCNYKFRHSVDACISDTNCPVFNIPTRVICTQGQGSNPPGSCLGDSGSPVVVNGVIAGLVCRVISKNNVCEVGTPSVHTNVADYLPWIYAIIDPERDTSGIPVAEEPDQLSPPQNP